MLVNINKQPFDSVKHDSRGLTANYFILIFISIDGGIFTARGYFVSCLEIYHSNIEHSVRAYYMLNSQVGEEWV